MILRKQPLLYLHYLTLIISIFCFLYVSYAKLIGEKVGDKAVIYSMLFAVICTFAFIGYKERYGKWQLYLLANIPMMMLLFFQLNYALNKIYPLNLNYWLISFVSIVASFLIAKWDSRYTFANGIYFGYWALLTLTYLYLGPMYGYMNTINIVFTDDGLTLLKRLGWLTLFCPIVLLPILIILELLFSTRIPNKNKNGKRMMSNGYGGSTYSGSGSYLDTDIANLEYDLRRLKEEREKEYERQEEIRRMEEKERKEKEEREKERNDLELKAKRLRWDDAPREEVDWVDRQLGRSEYEIALEDERNDYYREFDEDD